MANRGRSIFEQALDTIDFNRGPVDPVLPIGPTVSSGLVAATSSSSIASDYRRLINYRSTTASTFWPW